MLRRYRVLHAKMLRYILRNQKGDSTILPDDIADTGCIGFSWDRH